MSRDRKSGLVNLSFIHEHVHALLASLAAQFAHASNALQLLYISTLCVLRSMPAIRVSSSLVRASRSLAQNWSNQRIHLRHVNDRPHEPATKHARREHDVQKPARVTASPPSVEHHRAFKNKQSSAATRESNNHSRATRARALRTIVARAALMTARRRRTSLPTARTPRRWRRTP